MSIKDEVTNTPIYASLFGLKTVFEEEFGHSNIFFKFTEDEKSYLKRKDADSYPYSYLKLTGMKIPKDRANVKAIQRTGRLVGGSTNATTMKNYMMPTELSIEYQYFDSSLQRTLLFIEHFLLLAATEKLSFVLKFDEATEWNCRVEVPEASIQFSEAELGSTANPGALQLNLPFQFHTHCGFTRDVSRMQAPPTHRVITVS